MVLIASGIFVISLGNSGSSEFKIAKAMVSTTTYSQKCNKLIHIGMDFIVIKIVMDTGIMFNLLSLETNEGIRNSGYYF